MKTTPEGGIMNRTILITVSSIQLMDKRVANSPSKECRLSKHAQSIADKDKQCKYPDSQRTFEQNLQIFRVEMVQPRWEFPGIVESVKRRLIIAH